jgi:GT2 family glycosyltransferase
VGGLDEQFFIYSEEVDLCRRIAAAGWTLAWVPQAKVIHYGGQSTRQLAAKMFLQLYASKVLYFRKHDGAAAARIYKGILALAALGRLALTPLTIFEAPAARTRHRTLAGHYLRLLTALPGF